MNMINYFENIINEYDKLFEYDKLYGTFFNSPQHSQHPHFYFLVI